MGNCPTQWYGKNCTWTFNSDCTVATCTRGQDIWSTFELCSQYCCKASSNLALNIYQCDFNRTPLILGLTLGLGYPVIGVILFCLFAGKEQSGWVLLFVVAFWPFILIGYLFFGIIVISRDCCCDCSCKNCCDCSCKNCCDCSCKNCCCDENFDCRLIIVIPAMIGFFLVTLFGFLADILLIIISLGLVFFTRYKSLGCLAFEKWKDWIDDIKQPRPSNSASAGNISQAVIT